MITAIALLRSINVGGRFVKMDRLRAIFEEMGFTGVRTFIQSGNVMFSIAAGRIDSEMTGSIEAGLRAALGFDVAVMLISPQELESVFTANPYAGHTLVDDERLHVTLLKDAPTTEAQQRLKPNPASADEFTVVGRAVWILCRNGYGRTVYINSFFESKLKIAATTRNIETMGTLLGLAKETE
jgi:uncharacterized protein (DUF1697 family)